MKNTGCPRLQNRRSCRMTIVDRARRAALLALCLLAGGLPAADAAKEARLAANVLFNQGLYQQAGAAYSAFLAKHPRHAEAAAVQFALGLCQYQLKQYAAAEKTLMKVVALPRLPDLPRAFLFLGQAQLMQDKHANAEGSFDAGLKALGAEGNAALANTLQVNRLEALYHQRKWKQLAADAGALSKATGNRSARVAFLGASAYHRMREHEAAVAAFTALAPKVKGTRYAQQAHLLMADSLRQLRRFKEAAAELTAAARLTGPETAEALYQLAQVEFHSLQNPRAGLKHYREYLKAHRHGPRARAATIGLGRCQMALKDFRSAEATFGSLATALNDSPEVPLWQSRVYRRQGNPVRAMIVLDEAAVIFKDHPQRPQLLYDLGEAALAAGQLGRAGRAFDECLAAAPRFAQRAQMLRLNADCRHQLKNYAGSLKLCDLYLKEFAESAHAASLTFLRAENHYHLGAHAKAIAAYQEFIKTHPAHPQTAVARMRVGHAEYTLQNWAKALAVLGPLMEAGVNGPLYDQLQFLVAECHAQLDDPEKAVAAYRAFATARPKSANADLALLKAGQLSEQLGKPLTAQAVYAQLAKSHAASPHLPTAYYRLGVILYDGRKYEPARDVLTKLVALEGHKLGAGAEYYLARAEARLGNRLVAAERFGALADGGGTEYGAEARLRQGNLLLEAKEPAKAQAALERFLKDHADHNATDHATYQLGVALAALEQWPEAVARLVAVPATSDWRDNALYRAARCQLDANATAKAVPLLEELLAEFPESTLATPANLSLAEINLDAGKHDAVIAALQPLVDEQSRSRSITRIRYLLGGAYFGKGHFEESAEAYEGMLRQAPKDLVLTASWRAGESRRKLGEFSRALFHFQRAERAEVDDANATLGLKESAALQVAEMQGSTGRWRDALGSFEKFLENYPESKSLRLAQAGQAQAQIQQDQAEAALKTLDALLQAEAKDEAAARAQFLMGEYFVKMKDSAKALGEYAKVQAHAFPRWQARALYQTAQVQRAEGDEAAAKATLQKLMGDAALKATPAGTKAAAEQENANENETDDN